MLFLMALGCAPSSGTASITAAPWSLDFGEVTIGLEQTDSIELTNSGSSELHIRSLFLPGDFDVDADSLSIAPNETERIAVRFHPSREGEIEEALVLRSDAAGTAEVRIPVLGWGIPAQVQLDRSDFTCPMDGGVYEDSLTITSLGPGTLVASVDIDDGGGAFALDDSSGELTLEPGQSRAVSFSCSTEVYSEGALILRSNDIEDPEIRIPLYAEDPKFQVLITSHSDGEIVDAGPIVLKAKVSISDSRNDILSDQVLEATWSSERSGTLAVTSVGERGRTYFRALNQRPGEDTYTVSVQFPGEEPITDSLSLIIDDAPRLTALRPQEWWPGDIPVELRAGISDATDAAEDLLVTWESDRDGFLGESRPDSRGLAALDVSMSPGRHNLSVAVTNPRGLGDSAVMALNIVDCADDSDRDGDGYSPAGGDCDDDDPSLYPGSGRFIGEPLGCMGDSVVAIWGTDATPLPLQTLSAPADIDGDGLSDLILGDEAANLRGFATGAVFLLQGSSALTTTSDKMVRIRGDSYDGIGADVATIPDLDGDGIDELAFGAPYEDNGAVYLFSGRTNWEHMSVADADFVAYGLTATDEFGSAIGSGDLDGDGYTDLIIGAPGASTEMSSVGTVSIFRDISKFGGSATSDQAVLSIDGSEVRDFLGSSIVSGFDFNGDGLQDLAAGAIYRDREGGPRSTGAVYLFTDLSGSGRLDAERDAAATWEGRAPLDSIGDFKEVSSAGDVDGDGLDDLLIMIPQRYTLDEHQGVLLLIPGNEDPSLTEDLDTSAWSWFGERPNDLDGWATGLPDRDGDGRAELLVSSSPYSGEARLLSSRDIQGDKHHPIGNRSTPIAGAGEALGSAGDIDGDGRGDFALTSTQDLGTLYLYLGGPTCPSD